MIFWLAIAGGVLVADAIPPEPERSKEMQQILTLDDAGIDAQFQCPDTLPSSDDEIWKIGLFLYWAKNKHPDWTYSQKVEFRHQLFIKHHCGPWVPSK